MFVQIGFQPANDFQKDVGISHPKPVRVLIDGGPWNQAIGGACSQLDKCPPVKAELRFQRLPVQVLGNVPTLFCQCPRDFGSVFGNAPNLVIEDLG